MYTRQKLIGLAAVAVCLTLSACSDKTQTDEKESPAVVTEIEGSDLQQVTLTEKAVERVGVEMGAVAESAGIKTVPYAAVVYDEHGAAWVYTSPQPLTFVRSAITVSEIADETAFLAAGPDPGTGVVTVGTAELFGTELGIGY